MTLNEWEKFEKIETKEDQLDFINEINERIPNHLLFGDLNNISLRDAIIDLFNVNKALIQILKNDKTA